jgi:hypothetical protein
MTYLAHDSSRGVRRWDCAALPLFCCAMFVITCTDRIRCAERSPRGVHANASRTSDAPSFIIVHFGGRRELSTVAAGILFDFYGTGEPVRMPWPLQASNAWLVLDRNGNGRIDNGGELFGNRTPLSDGRLATHGFDALAEFDVNHDGVIDAADPVFQRLAIWADLNRNGMSDPGELTPIQKIHLILSVRFQESHRSDRWGNVFAYEAPVSLFSGERRVAYEVVAATTE